MVENQTVKGRLIAYIRYLGIGQGKFETRCGLANGYVNNIRQSITPKKLQQIARCNPDLNTGWLMTGEGEMLRPTQSVGDISSSNVIGVNVNGTDIRINPDAYSTLMEIVKTNQRTIEKFQEEIDRLLTIIETANNKASENTP